MIFQRGKIGINLNVLISISLDEAYLKFPNLPKLVIKAAHKEANPISQKKRKSEIK